ncbi:MULTISPECIES: succinate dehydrogenase assembly factor 2 [unclassified Chelatococcus]|jgi:antitoxin CptB|uniref:FAD assembly factor SdhE n=1 Tax=unclassified Chelatococcus TaxID=2638111 RepID=UPI001BCE934B|nr:MULTISPECIES: succinate dehydrogenase assembly factor 2 [unclassified Chelatococcus]CAH1672606.1 FAD assembly factor SdhE [Hyphomicrobiales bacterium]MBS7738930.1 succinate dehydrogenase assembly factor 2 [Chelatococcus sp. HY11]MBX3543363.1 succinate dehydrogenase assembly factor 2 [Chelatococcus sp.]MCO5076541.1 succinate dehydrogenase assembly factor 2 [Chelatococcus sp.]CAH1675155.1 FAD assembly factor SdhE [Hyphomicrobiales bacterium]
MDTESDVHAVRLRRLKFRAWHRGMREMDLIFGRFADAKLPELDEADLAAFESLLDEQDKDIFSWYCGEVPLPLHYDTPFFAKLRAFPVHRM